MQKPIRIIKKKSIPQKRFFHDKIPLLSKILDIIYGGGIVKGLFKLKNKFRNTNYEQYVYPQLKFSFPAPISKWYFAIPKSIFV